MTHELRAPDPLSTPSVTALQVREKGASVPTLSSGAAQLGLGRDFAGG